MKVKREIERIYSLSPMQEGMLFNSLLDDRSTAYFEQNTFMIDGTIQCGLLEKSFNLLVKKYEVLRTAFVHEKVKKPVQVIIKETDLNVHFEDITHLSGEEKEAYVEEFKKNDRQRVFNLTKDQLIRISLLRTGERSYMLVWSFHHIIMDGWCLGIIFQDLIDIYRSLKRGETVTWEPVTSYENYIKWLKDQDKEAGLKFWQESLEDCEQPTVLPTTKRKTEGNEFELKEYNFEIRGDSFQGLKKLAVDNRTTINTVTNILWGIQLQRYNNSEDAVFGAVVSGRPSEIDDVERMIGLFVNTVPFRVRCTGEKKFPELLKEVQDHTLQSRSYEYLPLAEIQSQTILKNELISTDDIDTIEDKVSAEIQKAVDFAEAGTFEPVEDLKKFVYSP